MSEVDYKKLYEDEKKKVSVLEQQLAKYEVSGAVGFYYELNKTLNDIVALMREKKIKTLLGEDTDKKEFDRYMGLVKFAKENFQDLEDMKGVLGEKQITGNEETDTRRRSGFLERSVS